MVLDQRWKLNHRNLADIQSRWLDIQAAKMIDCRYYQQNECRSCQWLEIPYSQQLTEKQYHLKQQLISINYDEAQWVAPFQSNEQGFRNKAKMVVSGSVERPILGILKIMIHKVRLICVIVLFILHIFQQFFQFSKILLVAQV